MLTATRIIPRPPATSKYFSASIVFLLCASTLQFRFHRHRLLRQLARYEEHPEHLSENQFFRQQCHRQREDQPSNHCHECDCHLHDCLPRHCSELPTPFLEASRQPMYVVDSKGKLMFFLAL